MKVLCIGNSFTQDPMRYAHRIAYGLGHDIKFGNLVIGGCSLETHFKNMMSGLPKYAYEQNGVPTGISISLAQGLAADSWDIVTLQQASHSSFDYSTYQPYISELAAYIRRFLPGVKIYIQQTWAYEADSDRLHNVAGFGTPVEMYEALAACYDRAAAEIGADGLIPSGTAMLRALELGAMKVHRDTFHASLGLGRYLQSLTWLATLGIDITEDTFDRFDEPLSDGERAIAVEAALYAVEKYRK